MLALGLTMLIVAVLFVLQLAYREVLRSVAGGAVDIWLGNRDGRSAS